MTGWKVICCQAFKPTLMQKLVSHRMTRCMTHFSVVNQTDGGTQAKNIGHKNKNKNVNHFSHAKGNYTILKSVHIKASNTHISTHAKLRQRRFSFRNTNTLWRQTFFSSFFCKLLFCWCVLNKWKNKSFSHSLPPPPPPWHTPTDRFTSTM